MLGSKPPVWSPRHKRATQGGQPGLPAVLAPSSVPGQRAAAPRCQPALGTLQGLALWGQGQGVLGGPPHLHCPGSAGMAGSPAAAWQHLQSWGGSSRQALPSGCAKGLFFQLKSFNSVEILSFLNLSSPVSSPSWGVAGGWMGSRLDGMASQQAQEKPEFMSFIFPPSVAFFSPAET